ncbi:MAG: EAL domain-containing protein [Angustibacter sp.]
MRWPRVQQDDDQVWRRRVETVLADPKQLTLVFQPIVSVADAAVVGYEALSRFAGSPSLTPDLWFAAADRLGLGAALEAEVLRRCLGLRDSLPDDCFLTVNLSPHLLDAPAVRDLLLAEADLSRVVIELTEHVAVPDADVLAGMRAVVTERGGLIAMDDAGSGYSGLQQLTVLRPQLVKLDRALVDGADRDPLKLALAELLGELADRMDAWLLAEGVETWAELEAFARLAVPLYQGYLLGRPAPPWSRLDAETVARLRTVQARTSLVENVAGLVEDVAVEGRSPVLPGRHALRVDGYGRPVRLLLPGGDDGRPHREVPVTLRVPPSAGVGDVARRAASRPDGERFHPVVCVDDTGAALGLVRVEQLLVHLARLKTAG